MKHRAASLAILSLTALMITALAPGLAAAETVTGRKYSVYIYSQYVSDPATTVTFKDDGVMLMSAYSGFGMYFSSASTVVAVFSAPEVEKNKDLFMVMGGMLTGDFLSGLGITFTNYVFSEIFLFSGYATSG